MVYKRCPCKSTQCTHPWYVQVNIEGRGVPPEKGVATKYARLLARAGKKIPTTKGEALALENLVRTWVGAGRPAWMLEPEGDPAPQTGAGFTGRDGKPVVTLADAAREYLLHYLDAKKGVSEPGVVRAIVEAYGKEPLVILQDRTTVANYLAAVQVRTSTANSNHHFARWSHFLNWARAEYKFAGESPFFHKTLRPHGLRKHDENDHRYRRLTEGEEARLVQAMRTLDDGGMMIGRFHAALDAMLRRSEMLGVKREHVIRDKATGATLIRIPKANAKSKKMREIPVLSKRLLAFIEARRFAPYVFGQADGAVCSVNQFRNEWRTVLHVSGITTGAHKRVAVEGTKNETQPQWVVTLDGDLHWHDLRHEGASRLHESHAVPLRAIQKILGHASLATTERYLNPTDRGLVDNLRAYAQAAGI